MVIHPCVVCCDKGINRRPDRVFVCDKASCKLARKQQRNRKNKAARNPNYKPRERLLTPEERRANLLASKKRYRESEDGIAARQAYLQVTTEERREKAREYHKTYEPPSTVATRRRRRWRAIRKSKFYRAWQARKARRIRNLYALRSYYELKAAGQGPMWAMKSKQRYNIDAVKQRRREGSAAYNMLCDMGQFVPVQGAKAQRKAHREARRVMIAAGFAQQLKDATQ